MSARDSTYALQTDLDKNTRDDFHALNVEKHSSPVDEEGDEKNMHLFCHRFKPLVSLFFVDYVNVAATV